MDRYSRSVHRLLNPPIFPDEDDTYRAGLIHFYLLFLLALGPTFAALRLTTFGLGDLQSWAILLAVPVTVGVVGLLHRGAITFAAHYGVVVILLVSLLGGLTGARAQSTIASLMITLILAGLLLGWKSLVLYTTLCITVAGVTLIRLEDDPKRLAGLWSVYTVFLIAAAVMLLKASTLLRQLFARARASEKGLSERNRQLEAEILERQRLEAERVEFAILQAKHGFLQEFLGNISHDLKTPLAVMKTNLYLLEKALPADIRLPFIKRLNDQTDLLNKMVQDIITISRLDYAPELNLVSLSINDLLTEIVGQLHDRAAEKQLHFEMALDATAPHVTADWDELCRAFTNLLENAIHYTPPGGTISIRSHATPDHIWVEIRDTGIGIDPADLPRVFERFYRAKQARELSHTGTGLGLAIVKKIMEMHGAAIDLTSIRGMGTTVHVKFALDGHTRLE